VLRGEGRKGSHGDNPLSSSWSILPSTSKPEHEPKGMDGSSEMEGALRGEGRKGSHGDDSLSSLESMLPATSKSMSQLATKQVSMENNPQQDRRSEVPPPAVPTEHGGGAIFTLEDGTEQILSVAGNRAISVQGMF
jgi:hypothetical protein